MLPPPADGGILIQTDGGTFTCYVAPCQGHVYQCGDCIDNDGDGLIDSQDPDCLGACQNNESGFTGNIPGQNNAPCKSDCYWDQDTGSGNDDCYWDHSCDPFEQGPPAATNPEIGCAYDPEHPRGRRARAQRARTTAPTFSTTSRRPAPTSASR